MGLGLVGREGRAPSDLQKLMLSTSPKVDAVNFPKIDAVNFPERRHCQLLRSVEPDSGFSGQGVARARWIWGQAYIGPGKASEPRQKSRQPPFPFKF